ncbi:MAG: lipid-A-disaccharide synthase [Chitinophagaceae bacterium]|nr:lipid-A-disaccharide synthase [Chitinophagaceae bacterium]
MKYFVIAGEASGDMHAANMIKYLQVMDAEARVAGWGGDQMQAQGVQLMKHIQELAFMGFAEVLMNIGTILKNFTLCKKQISAFKPDLLVLVDYPGFNLRMAGWAKKQGYKVVYYISPTVWAWKENRIVKVKKYVDRMICILPFEKAFYARWDYAADYVGHPTVEVIEREKAKPSVLHYKNVIALLPGSRKQEIDKMLPVMLQAVAEYADFQILIAQAPNLNKDVYAPHLKNTNAELLQHQTYNILKIAKVAIVTSGTATLETALFNVPQLVCYIANPVSYAIAKQLVKVKYISLVNLILDKPAVLELIQDEVTSTYIRREVEKLLKDNERKEQLQADYDQLKSLLHEGSASEQVAEIIYQSALNH